jgi:hypothetical protein
MRLTSGEPGDKGHGRQRIHTRQTYLSPSRSLAIGAGDPDLPGLPVAFGSQTTEGAKIKGLEIAFQPLHVFW